MREQFNRGREGEEKGCNKTYIVTTRKPEHMKTCTTKNGNDKIDREGET
jgi:hypothetical protein